MAPIDKSIDNEQHDVEETGGEGSDTNISESAVADGESINFFLDLQCHHDD